MDSSSAESLVYNIDDIGSSCPQTVCNVHWQSYATILRSG